MSQGNLSVAVVGGGIGGLAAALSLQRVGFDVQVFEQAVALGEIGAGIQITPNASRVLHRLGLAEALDRTGVRPVAAHRRRWDDLTAPPTRGDGRSRVRPALLPFPSCRPAQGSGWRATV